MSDLFAIWGKTASVLFVISFLFLAKQVIALHWKQYQSYRKLRNKRELELNKKIGTILGAMDPELTAMRGDFTIELVKLVLKSWAFWVLLAISLIGIVVDLNRVQ